jgi:histidinol-phosphate aminotransferase
MTKLDLKKFSAVALAHKGVRGLQPYQPGKPIAALERELGTQDIIKLASNENPLGPSPLALSVMARHLNDLHYYPDASGIALKDSLAQMHSLSPDHFTLGNGSENIVDLVVRAFCQPGDEIMVSEYAFIAYQIIARGLNVDVNQIPSKQYGHDLDAMRAAVNKRTKVVFIVNPNNPTGTYLTASAIKTFMQAIPSDVLVVLDEAYFDYMASVPDYQSGATLIADFPNLIVMRTFSKAYGLAGIRIGYGISHPDIQEILNRIRQPFNVNSLALVAATAALQDTAHVEKTVALNQKSLQSLSSAFSSLGFRYVPSHTNFMLVNLEQDSMPIYQALLMRGVIVRPLVPYGLSTYLRISTGTMTQTNRFIDAFSDVTQYQECINE